MALPSLGNMYACANRARIHLYIGGLYLVMPWKAQWKPVSLGFSLLRLAFNRWQSGNSTKCIS